MLTKHEFDRLQLIANAEGVEVILRPHGHIQLKGELLVNWYPGSKHRTAYVNGTVEGIKYASPEQVVAMAKSPPKVLPKHQQDTRRTSYRGVRARMLQKSSQCYWCKTELTLDTSTLDHRIPLARGGLDHPSNWVLACKPCNAERGCAMPELVKGEEPNLEEEADQLRDSIEDVWGFIQAMEAKLVKGVHSDPNTRCALMHQKAEAVKKLHKYKARLKWLNQQLSERASMRYQSQFSRVAKTMLDPATYQKILDKVQELNDEIGTVRSEGDSGLGERDQAPDDPAVEVSEDHPCGVHDASSVQPECQFEPSGPGEEDAGASPQ